MPTIVPSRVASMVRVEAPRRQPRSTAFAKTKVQNLDHALRRDLDVRRFEIAMNDVLAVRGIQPGGDLLRDVDRFSDVESVLGALAPPGSFRRPARGPAP